MTPIKTKLVALGPGRVGTVFLTSMLFAWGWLGTDGLAMFVHPPSLLLTIGGTAVVTFLTFPMRKLRALRQALREAAVEPAAGAEIARTKEIARGYRIHGVAALERTPETIENPFLRRGIELLLEWKAMDEIEAKLEAEHLRTFAHFEDCRRILLTIGKLLPAFGLIGTLVSLVLLLQQSSALTSDTAGPSLALAILTTLYGAILANAVVLPLEAKLQAYTERLPIRFEIGLRATRLVNDQAYPSVIDSQLACLVEPDAPSEGTEVAGTSLLTPAESRASS